MSGATPFLIAWVQAGAGWCYHDHCARPKALRQDAPIKRVWVQNHLVFLCMGLRCFRALLTCCKCCRWDVVSTDAGTWEMQVVATSAVSEGEEALLTYGDHPNAHFLLHYGFV